MHVTHVRIVNNDVAYLINVWHFKRILQGTVLSHHIIRFKSRVRIRLKILYSNFLFIHREAEVGIWFYIVKTAIQAEICDPMTANEALCGKSNFELSAKM